MVIGKTSSISKADILAKYTETEIFAAAFPNIKSLPCKIQSPFRMDKNPSFSIFVDNESHIRYKDHGCPDDKGGLFDLLCKCWNCSFVQCLEKISDILVKKEGIQVRTTPLKTLTRKEIDTLTKIQVAVRPWKDYDYEYWESYGIGKQWLRYAEIYPISHKIVTKKENIKDKGKQYVFSSDKYAYCFVERKEGKLSLKIYQPFNTDGFKWCSKMDASVISLWTKVPEYGDRIIIASSMKDALCISANLHIPAIAPQGEGYDISDTACAELRRRYKKVFICFDTDAPGKKDAEKLAAKTGFINIQPDLGSCKDVSDWYKSLDNKEDFKKLEKLFY